MVLCACMSMYHASGQEKDQPDSVKNLENVIISFNKWEQKINEVPNKIVNLNMREARLRNPQTTADLLAVSGAVFVQKSQPFSFTFCCFCHFFSLGDHDRWYNQPTKSSFFVKKPALET